MSLQPYYNFWSQLFNLPEADLKNSASEVVSNCRYVEKYGDDYIFQYQDLTTKKRILAASVNNLEKFNLSVDETASNFELVFDDVDYCLDSIKNFKSAPSLANLEIRRLSFDDLSIVEKFLADCSEDDADVLDLNLTGDIAFGAFVQGSLVGISRYIVIKGTDVADITVAVGQNERGNGYSKPLVSAVVEHILAANLYPKYRVKADLQSSVRVALGLGFEPKFKLQTFALRNL